MLDLRSAPKPVFSYHTIFISDIHLSSNKTASPYLYEFLSHLDYDALKEIYLVGDIIGGWERKSIDQEQLPEMERRILDILNYAAHHGVKIHFIPGNHDEKIRPLVDMLQNRKSFNTFHKNITFEQYAIWNSGGESPKRLKVKHGDQNDPKTFVKWWFKPIADAVSATYDMLVDLNYKVSQFMYEKYGKHFNISGKLKKSFKSIIGWIFSHDKLLQGLDSDKIDGEITGHTHTALFKILKNKKGKDTYNINDGDWVEDCNAAVVVKPGDLPIIIDYKAERENHGFGDLPEKDDPHPERFAKYRHITDRYVRAIHLLWPARNRKRVVQKLLHAEEKYVQHHKDRINLNRMMDELDKTRVFNNVAREQIMRIIAETKRATYKTINSRLTTLFGNHANKDEPINNAKDYDYLQKVVFELGLRSERKMRKHKEHMEEASAKLDMHSPARGLRTYTPRHT